MLSSLLLVISCPLYIHILSLWLSPWKMKAIRVTLNHPFPNYNILQVESLDDLNCWFGCRAGRGLGVSFYNYLLGTALTPTTSFKDKTMSHCEQTEIVWNFSVYQRSPRNEKRGPNPCHNSNWLDCNIWRWGTGIIRNPLGFSNVQTISGIIGSHEDTHVLNACLPARQELLLNGRDTWSICI